MHAHAYPQPITDNLQSAVKNDDFGLQLFQLLKQRLIFTTRTSPVYPPFVFAVMFPSLFIAFSSIIDVCHKR